MDDNIYIYMCVFVCVFVCVCVCVCINQVHTYYFLPSWTFLRGYVGLIWEVVARKWPCPPEGKHTLGQAGHVWLRDGAVTMMGWFGIAYIRHDPVALWQTFGFAFCGCWFDLLWRRSQYAQLIRLNKVEKAVQCSVFHMCLTNFLVLVITLSYIYIYIYIL